MMKYSYAGKDIMTLLFKRLISTGVFSYVLHRGYLEQRNTTVSSNVL